MKTDRFSDIIRRKLESIRPEFTDKDWTRMQASLQQAMPPQPGSPATGTPFSGGVWSGSSWLLAAASVSTVVLIAFSLWQRGEINTLRETVGQLKQQAVATQPASPTPGSPALSRLDSQHHAQPAPETGPATQAAQPLPDNQGTTASTRAETIRSSERQKTISERTTGQLDIPPKQRDAVAVAGRTSVPVDDARTQLKSNTNSKTDVYGASSTPLTNTQLRSAPSVATGKPVRRSAPEQPTAYAETRSQTSEPNPVSAADNRTVTDRNGSSRNRSTMQAGNASTADGQSAKPTRQSSETTAPASDQATVHPPESAVAGMQSQETYKLANSLPLSLANHDWNSALIRRAKRMRLVQPPAPVATQSVAKAANVKAPASQPVTPLAAGLRVGAGSDVGAHQWSIGAFSEIQLNRHWAVGVGLSRATYLGGLFITAIDFDNRTHRDFQKEFGPRLNPKPIPKGDDILNIDTRVQRFQIPLSLSYRIPLNRTLTLLPTVGTYLNLSSTEKIAFYFRDTPGRFDQANFSVGRSVTLLNAFILGTSIEWQSRHWAIQGSPLLTLPTELDSDWQKEATLGFRTRVYYQF